MSKRKAGSTRARLRQESRQFKANLAQAQADYRDKHGAEPIHPSLFRSPAMMAMERAGLTNGIEFFDEPSRHLSQEGVLDLAETLTERAVSSHKRIFIVEHNLLDYPYAGAVTILKSDEGSTIK